MRNFIQSKFVNSSVTSHFLKVIFCSFTIFLAVNICLASTAVDFDTKYRLTVDDGGFYTNTYGLNEKFLRGKPTSTNYEGWYFILPTGELFSFNGTISTSTSLGQVSSAYYDNPFFLTEGALTQLLQDTAYSFNIEYELNVHSGGFYTNTRGFGEKYLRGKSLGAGNDGWYFILPHGTLYSFYGNFRESRPIARLDPIYYNDPLLLTEAIAAEQLPVATSPEEFLTASTLPSSTNTTTASTTSTTFPCEYNEVQALYREGNYVGAPVYQRVDSLAPTCINNTILNAHSECYNRWEQLNYDSNFWPRIDDCVAWKVFGALVPHSFSALDFGSAYSWASFAQRYKSYDAPYYGADAISILYIKRNEDGTCSPVSTIAQGADTCYAGTYFWYNSPISLLMDEQVDVDNDFTFTTFPLDLRKNRSNWYVWKASGRAPLLVYDPDHTGIIKSATQLFGDWTFGGKKEAKMVTSRSSDIAEDASVVASPWENGYEPLALMDKNNDGKISDTELDPLGLWFDNNRNGISEPGEVEPLGETKVVTLYYRPNRKDSATMSLFADKGYERLLDGKLTVGRSVDWRSDNASSKDVLVNKHLAPGLGCPAAKASSEKSKYRNICLSEAAAQTANNRSITENIVDLSGLWQWQTGNSNKAVQPAGYFGFSTSVPGKLRGHSYSVFGVNNKRADFTDIFSLATLNGTSTRLKDGNIKLTFSISPNDTSVLESTAIYYPASGKILGKTKAKVSVNMKAVDITYSWIASRVIQHVPQH